jgi:purine-cytosine permease-like protein
MTERSYFCSRFAARSGILIFVRTYLRIFNPLVALLVFGLCSFSAMKEDKGKPIVIGNIVMGGIPTYFFAKGMFCGVALILLGKILESQLERNDR